MSACGLAVGVGLDELLDPPSPAHPISSNEKEQVDTNLRTTDELSDFMETPGRWSSSARTSEDQIPRAQVKTKTEGCDTAGPFEVAQAAGFQHVLTAKKPQMGGSMRRRSFAAFNFQVRRGAERSPLGESCPGSDSHYPEGTPNVQGMFTGCVGGEGGVAHGPVVVEKSKNSVISGMAASRAVRLGKWKRVSISLSAAV